MLETALRLRQTIRLVIPFLNEIPLEVASERPLPNKWSFKEIIGHLIDSASNNQQKFVRMMEVSHLDFVGYDQDVWVEKQQYNLADWSQLIALFEAYNSSIAHIIEHVKTDDLQHTVSINGSGVLTLEFIMKDYLEHLKHHIKAILPEIDFSNTDC